jgi:hypothetical protein
MQRLVMQSACGEEVKMCVQVFLFTVAVLFIVAFLYIVAFLFTVAYSSAQADSPSAISPSATSLTISYERTFVAALGFLSFYVSLVLLACVLMACVLHPAEAGEWAASADVMVQVCPFR